MDRKANLKAVYVEWLDPKSVDEWIDIPELKKVKAAKIQTLGWLIEETEDSLYLALNRDAEEDVVSCAMIIPKKFIIYRGDKVYVNETRFVDDQNNVCPISTGSVS